MYEVMVWFGVVVVVLAADRDVRRAWCNTFGNQFYFWRVTRHGGKKLNP